MTGAHVDLIGGQKKERNLQGSDLEREIAALEACGEADRGAESDLLHQLRLKYYEQRALDERHARAYELATQRLLYDVADKANKLLA
ncbi:hypothetical protein NDU88_006224 [Pleurodeles waltl]|uniref:Uncharacterized protein n=1 Tax=Pleurodeles waltl TaxID=8319 RepID=A0AAV7TZH6_PLEWA|nr:hypothetical protein NDU88_006224 [Pleurodeles waltl]